MLLEHFSSSSELDDESDEEEEDDDDDEEDDDELEELESVSLESSCRSWAAAADNVGTGAGTLTGAGFGCVRRCSRSSSLINGTIFRFRIKFP